MVTEADTKGGASTRPASRRRLIPTLGQLAVYRAFAGPAVAIAVVVVLGALAEAAALVMVVPIVDIVSTNGADTFTGSVGPFEVSLQASSLVWLTGGLILTSTALSIGAAVLRGSTVSSWERTMRTDVMRSYLDADNEFQTGMAPGALQELLGQHVVRAAEGLAAATAGIKAGLSLLILLTGALIISPVAAIILTVLGTGLMVGLRPLSRRAKASARQIARTDVRLGAIVSVAGNSSRDIRIFSAADGVLDEYTRGVEHLRNSRRRSATFAGSIPALYQGGGLLILLLLLGAAATSDSRDLPALGATAILLLRALGYGQQLSSTHQRFIQALPFANRLAADRELFDQNHAAFGDETLTAVETVVFTDLDYAYPASDSPAVSNVDLTISSPGIVGLAGPSGSGKSTLTALLLRLRRPTAGRMTVNGHSPIDYTDESWSSNVTLVPQDVVLLDRSVRENIAFHRSNVLDADIEAVCQRLGLHEMICAMPDGYDTLIGPGNRELSGGQRQRLGIARALVGRPSFLILDEPTSSLDVESEQWVHSLLDELRSTCLVVVTSHRAATLAICDRVVHVSEGLVVDTEQRVEP